MGLIIGAFVFGWIAVVFKRERLALSTRDCLILALISFFPTVFFGLMDWRHFYAGQWLTPVIIKMILAGVLLILLCIALGFSLTGKARSTGALVTYTLCVVVVVLLGWFGARLIYSSKPLSGGVKPTELAGEKTYNAYCAGCHPRGGNVVKPDKPLRSAPQLTSFEAFLTLLRGPVAPMPSFSDKQISDGEARNLYDYITNVLKASDGGETLKR